MNEEQQLKLQAWLDRELPDAEARHVEAWIASDPEAARLRTELENTNHALAGFEAGIRLPETREFYWSKIAREIERQEPRPAPAAAEAPSWIAQLRRFLLPAGSVAGLAIAALLALSPSGIVVPRVHTEAEQTAADSRAFTYHDYGHGVTLVWLSYPSHNEFTAAGSAATVQP